MGKRRRGSTINVYVDVDIYDVLSEIDDDDILEEVARRNLPQIAESGIDTEFLMDLYEELNRGRLVEARVMLEREIFPKWKSPDACQAAFATTKGKSDDRSDPSKGAPIS